MTSIYSQISFKDVASRYNQINAIPSSATTQLGKSLAGLVPLDSTVLDMGCGAGRVTLPATSEGLHVVGVDISGPMLQQAQQLAEKRPFDPVHADATALPFAARSFSAVLSINILHLVPQWQTVITNAVRLMQPKALFVQGRDWLDPASCAGRLRFKLREVVMGLAPGLRPTAAASPAVMASFLDQLGGTTTEPIVAARWTTPLSPADVLNQMESRTHNETWMLGDDLLAQAVAQLRHWASETWEDVSAVEQVERRFHFILTHGLA